MNKKKYFNDLLTLFEDIGMAGTEEVVPQENIADDGSDVNPDMNAEMPDESQEEVENSVPEENMTSEIPMSNAENMENIMLSQKLLKLYELYKDLLNYCTVFLDSLGNIDISLLDIEAFKLVKKYTVSTKELTDKINNYMINIYENEDYEKLLYVYILFRTELTTCIRGIRDILKLNNLDEKLDKKSNGGE